MLCGSAFKNKGVQAMLDAVIDYMPAPVDIPPVKGTNENGQPTSAAPTRRRAVLRPRVQDHDRPVRRPAHLLPRLLGRGELGRHDLQPGQGPQGAHRPHPADARERARRDQGSARGRHRRGGGPQGLRPPATRCATADKIITLEKMEFPEPVIHVAVEPKTKADQEKMGIALNRLAQEDPSFRVRTDEESGQTIISGMGELHLEIIVDRMKREFGVEANVGAPQVAYRETIKKPCREGRRQVHQAVGRPRPVRPRVAQAGAAGAGQGLRVRRCDQRRLGAARIHSGGAEGRQGHAAERRARGLPGRGRQGDAVRRLVPRGRFERKRVQDGGLDRLQGRHAPRRARCCSSR